MRCLFGHASAIAARAQSSNFAGKCDEKFIVAAAAAQTHKTRCERAAGQKALHAGVDKAGDVALATWQAGAGLEREPVGLNGLPECGLARLARLVGWCEHEPSDQRSVRW